jgi:cytoskeletal protein CcmA (bactofilin family)
MKTVIRFLSVLVLAILLFLPMRSVGASGGSFEGQVVFGQSFTLKSADTLNGDLLVFGGSATIEAGATVNGSVVLFGGNLTVEGIVNGDVAVTGGQAYLGPAAHITGNLSTVAASLDRSEGSQVDGHVYNTATSWISNGENGNTTQPDNPIVPIIPQIKFDFQPLVSVMNIFGQSLGIAILAMLLMLFLAPHADRVAHAILVQPLTAGGLGLLTIVVAPITIVVCVITLILIPMVPIIVVALVVAGVFGWIAIGYEVGQRFTKALHQNWHPAFSAGLGTFALTLVSEVLINVPVLNCVGWLVPFLLSMAAVGAVLMTRFGTQTVVAPAVQVAVVPTKPAE